VGSPTCAGPAEDCNQGQDQERAINGCTEFIRNNPRNAFAYVWRGIAFNAKGDFDRAIADFNRAIEINPKIEYPYNCRGEAYGQG
jgi:tetratricopeptide (TPR) repeat protein